MRRRQLLLVGFGASIAACGGGNVDRGFYGEIQEEPSTGAAPRPKVKTKADRNASGMFMKPKLVVIRAAWCPHCREIEPTLMSTFASYQGKVDLVILDITDDAATTASIARASEEGVKGFFDKYGARTPTIGVFTGVEKGRLVHGDLKDPETLKRELDHVVGRVPDPPGKPGPSGDAPAEEEEIPPQPSR
jgi:thiol-disulfide isomerase/thioredoxin